MITEDYCSQEVVKMLKEKGFKIPQYYNSLINMWQDTKVTHQMAMKWLRERCCYIVVNPDPSDEIESTMLWWVEIMHKTDYKEFYDFDTYEEAVEAALKYCLINLI